MAQYTHTEDTTNLFNKVLNDYLKIESDNDLEERRISYKDYQNLGLLIDGLRFHGKTTPHNKGIKNYFELLGCVTEKVNEDDFISKLK